MNEERNKAVVARFDELGNGNGDPDTLDELCTPDINRRNGELALSSGESALWIRAPLDPAFDGWPDAIANPQADERAM